MDMNSFGEDLVVKTRKPYTITKQREKWTEEEHSRFLEALKLHGRAWQRIEDHIGTKTAIQIRSHAQKFFTKLEKEAVATGTPLGQAHAIDIPPPRPKKKPNYPYPRKTMNPLPQELSTPEASVAPEPLRRTKQCSDDDDARRSAILNLLPDAPPSASIGGGSKIHSGFREYVPAPPEPKEPCMESTSNGITDSPSALHTCSAMSYISHPFPTFPPLPQLPSASASAPAALSREIASALLQNPGVYAAACVAAAASLWPSEEMYSPSMAALVAATVAAASAWWATNGPISFAISPSPPANSAPDPQAKAEEGRETSSSSSNLEEIEKTLSDFKPLSDAAAGHHDSLDGEKMRKRDRSSCGSNATSGSEIETDAALIKKNGETNKDEAGEAHSENLPAGEATTRRARSSPFVNEAWKEVSQQGRLAFQALFAGDSLPQSFATRLAKPEMELPEGVAPIGRGDQQIAQNCCSRPNEIIIKHGNLINKVRRTGFKPYKRCAAEADLRKKSSANDETSNKKIRV